MVHDDRRASIRPPEDPLHRCLDGRQESVTECWDLLLVPGLGIDELRRGERVIPDFETQRELRLAATCSSTSLQLKVLTSPEVIC